ncbi:hypothetical protein [Butyrivibrio sp. AE2032]|uniref:hypothetical protein n=1 Tax=Butyrivibrio sp. AE2032 TaxID=1458463 RepID=UPI00163AB0C0|nr:hypothetical protein [Butyrivibrio sp. AE2032]
MDRLKIQNLIELFDLISEVFTHVGSLSASGNTDAAIDLLQQCQESAVAIGTAIEEDFGEGTATVAMLEKLCEDIYMVSTEISGESSGSETSEGLRISLLQGSLSATRSEFTREFPCGKEIAFLPCSPALWPGFDSLYKSLKKDTANHVLVIPIPWYDKKPDYTLDKDSMHYDPDNYPSYVDITAYDSVDLAGIHPDTIYIQAAYDNDTLGGSIHPSYYTSCLKGLCDELIFIPPYIIQEPDVNDLKELEKLREYLCPSGINNVSRIILQSENMKEAMIRLLAGKEESQQRQALSEKIVGKGHPRVEAIKEMSDDKDSILNNLPVDWKSSIFREDGTKKKVTLFSNSITSMLTDGSSFIKRIEDFLNVSKGSSDEETFIWHPHPEMPAVMSQLRPELIEDYKKLLADFTDNHLGILDTSNDPATAIVISDNYCGDPGSVMELFNSSKLQEAS